jgi:hypothetical protein
MLCYGMEKRPLSFGATNAGKLGNPGPRVMLRRAGRSYFRLLETSPSVGAGE